MVLDHIQQLNPILANFSHYLNTSEYSVGNTVGYWKAFKQM